jgi:hypothetical protein
LIHSHYKIHRVVERSRAHWLSSSRRRNQPRLNRSVAI